MKDSQRAGTRLLVTLGAAGALLFGGAAGAQQAQNQPATSTTQSANQGAATQQQQQVEQPQGQMADTGEQLDATTQQDGLGGSAQVDQQQPMEQQQQAKQQQQQANQQQQGDLGQQMEGGQQAGFGNQQIEQQQGIGSTGIQRGRPFVTGTISGTVTGLNLASGIIRVATSNRSLSLYAHPLAIAALNPGDVVSLSYANYGGTLWVEAAGVEETAGTFAINGQISGAITGVDKNRGLIAIRGITLRAHPEDMEQVLPGQFVSVTYAKVGNVNWAAGIQPVQQNQRQ